MRHTIALLAALLLRLRAILTTPSPEEPPPVSGRATRRRRTGTAGEEFIVEPWVTPDGQPTERFSPWE